MLASCRDRYRAVGDQVEQWYEIVANFFFFDPVRNGEQCTSRIKEPSLASRGVPIVVARVSGPTPVRRFTNTIRKMAWCKMVHGYSVISKVLKPRSFRQTVPCSLPSNHLGFTNRVLHPFCCQRHEPPQRLGKLASGRGGCVGRLRYLPGCGFEWTHCAGIQAQDGTAAAEVVCLCATKRNGNRHERLYKGRADIWRFDKQMAAKDIPMDIRKLISRIRRALLEAQVS